MSASEEILLILNDGLSRQIINKLTDEELSVQQLSSYLDIPQSSAYRKVRKLEDLDLIKKTKVVRTSDGSDENYYKSLVSQIMIMFKDGELSTTVEKFKMEDKMVRLWQKFSTN
jgi:DNA-binding transcriptional ArsR family regulator